MEMDEINKRFIHYAVDGVTESHHARVRQAANDFAREVAHEVPISREQSLALTKIEEAMFWANAGIARNE